MFSLVNSSFKKVPPDIKCTLRDNHKWNSAGFAKSVPDFEICAQSLNYFDTILYYFTSEHKFKEFHYFQALSAKILLFKGFSSALEIKN